ncbi:type II toxin-antitoxin system ParD family antitoxin [Marinicella gelatinilytica]|uniref:type II toxin-antitoxin system ParD family antitoxin n=1 Tax=Marinicella gelatinilytica TaxID=2996017 RepID=UPI00226095E3|nr:type II toxin-antitoxin system ParD family antitoxin [Marinicella gelatinilytica]MCX7545591.1 type II toxin-antitoxin system ParD family antitoxin [Marinicella gelatinilytica]
MATIRKTITLTNQQGDWIKSRVEDGQFTNESEYVRDLIRRDQQRNSELEALRAELIKGEQSGISSRTPDDIIKAVIAKKK